jgi:hypothetical protein
MTTDALETLHWCLWCEQEVPDRDWPDHEAGRDADRLECPIQDLAAVVASRPASATPGRYLASGTGLARLRW